MNEKRSVLHQILSGNTCTPFESSHSFLTTVFPFYLLVGQIIFLYHSQSPVLFELLSSAVQVRLLTYYFTSSLREHIHTSLIPLNFNFEFLLLKKVFKNIILYVCYFIILDSSILIRKKAYRISIIPFMEWAWISFKLERHLSQNSIRFKLYFSLKFDILPTWGSIEI